MGKHHSPELISLFQKHVRKNFGQVRVCIGILFDVAIEHAFLLFMQADLDGVVDFIENRASIHINIRLDKVSALQ